MGLSSHTARRAYLAQAALARARGVELRRPGGEPPDLPRVSPLEAARAAIRRSAVRLGHHGLLLALVGAVLGGELGVSLSSAVGPEETAAVALPREPAGADGTIAAGPAGPLSLGPIRLAPSGEAVEPALSRPNAIPSPFQAAHQLGEGETLGDVASRYAIPVEALVWANGLERGDALFVGQLLRVPRVSGVPYTVAAGDTVPAVAERFGVPLEAIVSFPPNGVSSALALTPGSEIFIPGARLELPEAIAGRRAEPAARVLAAETNIRVGPSTEHPRLGQLDAGRTVGLRARNGDWLEVELGALRGWIRVDMLEVSSDHVAALPVSNSFPAPPPRWVWPARGTITSGFGPRWRSFHNGLDIANRAWTPILAARAGRVKEAGWCRGYGYCVKIRHDGGMETIYGHLIDRPVVSRGDEVSAGELIGHMGSTYDRAGGGYSTGVHLHFTVMLNGRAVNPLRFLP